jgi:hypothetical protein
VALSTERRAGLFGAQLSVLVRDHFDVSVGEPDGFGSGAAVAVGGTGWFLAGREGRRSLGRALAWAHAKDIDRLCVLVADADELAVGTVARQATLFDGEIDVFAAVERDLVRAEPGPHLVEPDPPPNIDLLVELLTGVGIDVVVEHGVVTGQIEGLEVARVVVDDEGPQLQVGMGVNDRDAFMQMHGAVPTAEALATVIESVRPHRRPGAVGHPISRIALERWRRERLCQEPALIGMASLESLPPMFPATSVQESVAAGAIGISAVGKPTVVVTSAGIDLDLVPTAADLRHREAVHRADGRSIDLLLALPPRDAHPVTTALAARLRSPATVIGFDPLEAG